MKAGSSPAPASPSRTICAGSRSICLVMARLRSRRSASSFAACRSPGRWRGNYWPRLTRTDTSNAGVPLHGHPPDRHRHGAVPGRPRQLYRRPRLRDLDGAGIPAPRASTRCMRAGAEFGIGLFGSRALNALRLEKNYGSLGARVPADLRPAGGRARPLRRLCEGGRFHRQGGGAGRAQGRAASCGCAPSSSRPTTPTCIGDEPIWLGGAGARLGHVGRLRA